VYWDEETQSEKYWDGNEWQWVNEGRHTTAAHSVYGPPPASFQENNKDGPFTQIFTAGNGYTPLDGLTFPQTTPPQSLALESSEIELNPQYPGSVDATDIFRSNWLQDATCVGSYVAALGGDQGSTSSNWTASLSKGHLSASAPNALNEQNSNCGSAFESTGERPMLKDYQPLYQPQTPTEKLVRIAENRDQFHQNDLSETESRRATRACKYGCNYQFKTEEELQTHEHGHEKVKSALAHLEPPTCKYPDSVTGQPCNKTLKSKKNLNQHYREVHGVKVLSR